MKCPKCSHEKREGAEFCRGCVQQIKVQKVLDPEGKEKQCDLLRNLGNAYSITVDSLHLIIMFRIMVSKRLHSSLLVLSLSR